ncbi:MAG: ATP-binding protein, partial [Pseudomonadota bacterium]
RDNGKGIPERSHEKIFEIFHTLGPHEDGRRSTGIGLAIVKKIAEEQGGRIELLDASEVSDHTRGACVRFVLPPIAGEGDDEIPSTTGQTDGSASRSLDETAVSRDERDR